MASTQAPASQPDPGVYLLTAAHADPLPPQQQAAPNDPLLPQQQAAPTPIVEQARRQIPEAIFIQPRESGLGRILLCTALYCMSESDFSFVTDTTSVFSGMVFYYCGTDRSGLVGSAAEHLVNPKFTLENGMELTSGAVYIQKKRAYDRDRQPFSALYHRLTGVNQPSNAVITCFEVKNGRLVEGPIADRPAKEDMRKGVQTGVGPLEDGDPEPGEKERNLVQCFLNLCIFYSREGGRPEPNRFSISQVLDEGDRLNRFWCRARQG